jgi:hypothetical protein
VTTGIAFPLWACPVLAPEVLNLRIVEVISDDAHHDISDAISANVMVGTPLERNSGLASE